MQNITASNLIWVIESFTVCFNVNTNQLSGKLKYQVLPQHIN